jgi:RNA recognition motif-containing protein
MATKLFVGSLSFGVDDNKLKDFFSAVGEVVSADVITDRNSGRSKGFGFVEMSSDEEAKEAIKQLDGKELDGRSVNVSIAKPKEDRPKNSFGGNNFNRNRDNFSKRRY